MVHGPNETPPEATEARREADAHAAPSKVERPVFHSDGVVCA